MIEMCCCTVLDGRAYLCERCTESAYRQVEVEIEKLKAEIVRLKAEVERLSTPSWPDMVENKY